jgi:hypothetical protein
LYLRASRSQPQGSPPPRRPTSELATQFVAELLRAEI